MAVGADADSAEFQQGLVEQDDAGHDVFVAEVGGLVHLAHLDQAQRLFRKAAGQEGIQAFVHVGAVVSHLIGGGPR